MNNRRAVINLIPVFKITLFISVIWIACTGGIMYLVGSNNGIITVPGWKHGVIVCGESMVINHGHERDHEVQELMDLADIFCPKAK